MILAPRLLAIFFSSLIDDVKVTMCYLRIKSNSTCFYDGKVR